MRLCEHPDFDQAILSAEEHFRRRGLRAAVIEKDYYVTEVLRLVAAAAGDKVIFKGGTSLSKGWNLIQRFSEDIDLFLDPGAFEPALGKKGIDRELKRVRDAVAAHPALTFIAEESQTIGGFGRSDRFGYDQRFGGTGEIASRVLLEAGTASGREPTQTVELRSYLSEFLTDTGRSLDADDEAPFPFRLLHYRRTFVEKLFAIHAKIELHKLDGRPIGTYARHYYDLHQLATKADVLDMLRSTEYEAIKRDYDSISRASFPRDYIPPAGMSFAASDALFPAGRLAVDIESEYTRQCASLCYGPFATWEEVKQAFECIRSLL
ncbi:MAG: nucleotidyl transferase AbiEii/AbiGii toxin family protein [Planctomycetota bacterium]